MLFELPQFEYHEPTRLDDALQILHEHGSKAKIIGGGTDLLGLMKDRVHGPKMPIPEALISTKKIQELRGINVSGDEVTIGSAVTLSEITANEFLRAHFPGLVQAAASVATTQIKNMGTLGGNLCQRPWCWYFRHPAFDCFKKGGKQCYAVTGNNSTYFSIYNIGTCVMSHPSDTAPALISLGADVQIASLSRRKQVKISDFFLGPKSVEENILGSDEILAGVSLHLSPSNRRSIYLKQRIRDNWDFALASAAVAGDVDSKGTIASAKIVLGGVAPMPMILDSASNLVGKRLDAAAREEVLSTLARIAKPLRMNRYKVRIIRALVGRSLDTIFSV